VIHLEMPQDINDYIHRSGRTARAGRKGTSIVLVGNKEISLLDAVERGLDIKMTEIEVKTADISPLMGK